MFCRLARFDSTRVFLAVTSRNKGLGLGALFGVLASLSHFTAWAQVSAPEERTSFVYQVPQGCPERAEFVAQVIAKRGVVEPASVQIDTALAAVRVVAGDGFAAEIEFHPGYGVTRKLDADTCGDVLAGAVLVVVLSLAPLQQDEHGVSQSESVAAVPAAVEDTPASDSSSTGPLLEPPETPTARPGNVETNVNFDARSASMPVPRVDERTLSPEPRPTFHLGASAGFNNWVAPELVPELRIVLGLSSNQGRWGARVGGFWSTGDTSVQARRARFDVLGLRLEFAPYVLGEAGAWQLAIAALLDVARLRARGDATSELARGNSLQFWWFAPGLVARLATPEWYRVRVELQGDVMVPLRRPEFTFEQPFQIVHAPSPVAFGAHAALTVRVN